MNLHIRISLNNKLQPGNFDFLTKFAQKREFCSKTKNSEYYHGIMHMRIRLGIKFQLKPRILSFWTKFAQKGFFQSKTERVNIIEF